MLKKCILTFLPTTVPALTLLVVFPSLCLHVAVCHLNPCHCLDILACEPFTSERLCQGNGT